MGIWTWTRERMRAALRDFVLGAAVVEAHDVYFGKTSEDFQPKEYGNYIATSNPVYACAGLRAQLLASLPLRFYRTNRAGEREEVETGALVELMHKVNPFWTLGRLLRMTELSLCLWGEAFWFIERGKSGRLAPREIWWGRPDRVRVIPDAVKYVKGFVYRPANGQENITFTPDEVVWMPYDNPLDEYEGLSPLAAARLAVDTRSAAMKSNRNLFAQGMQMGGAVMPKDGIIWDHEQAKEMEAKLDQRYRGVDKAHRWGVFRMEVQMEQAGVTPKDAEFLGLMRLTLEDACRAYKVPLDLMGGQRSYENVNAAMRMLYDFCILPEARFVAEELTEKLLPMFPQGEADEAQFDSSEVVVLQEDATESWERDKGKIECGALTVNEWREGEGLEAVSWGDTWWAPIGVLPAGSAPVATDGTGNTDEERGQRVMAQREIEYDSAEHRTIWRRYAGRTESQEREVAGVVGELFRRQRDSILDRLRAWGARQAEEEIGAEGLALEPFSMAHWTKEFRMGIREVLEAIVRYHGQAALEDLGLQDAVFYATQPEVIRFITGRAQRFAEEVNETTWSMLKASLNEGILEGEGIPALEERVREIMATRIRSSAETIARTEVVGGSNGGILEAWGQSGVVEEKTWISALIPGRTRDSHVAAHGQTVALRANFRVGGGEGPSPGQIGLAEEDINCLCTMNAGLKGE